MVSGFGQNEVRTKRSRALVEQLVVRMLSCGTNAAPQNGHGMRIYGLAVQTHALAVAFRFKLLEIERQQG